MRAPRGIRVIAQRTAWGNLWESHKRKIASTQSTHPRVLVAEHAKRGPRICKEMQSMPEIDPKHPPTRGSPYSPFQSLAVRLMGSGYCRHFPESSREQAILNSQHRLLHQMGWGWAFSQHQGCGCKEVHLEKHHYTLRNSSHPHLGQRPSIL